jgi:hypothetical protein
MDNILGKMLDRMTEIRSRVGNNDGFVDNVTGLMKQRWEACGGYKVSPVGESGEEFSVVRVSETVLERRSKYTLNIKNKRCTCGEWQEHDFPCIHAITYFRWHEQIALDEVFAQYVGENYTFAKVKEMVSISFIPVCLETLVPDGETLPPKASLKRPSGRPKKKRFRKRSKYAYNPEDSNIVCSKCKQRGHNVRTCDIRARMKTDAENTNKTYDVETKEDLLDLS